MYCLVLYVTMVTHTDLLICEPIEATYLKDPLEVEFNYTLGDKAQFFFKACSSSGMPGGL
jgi:hypothetical protein